MPLGGCWHRDLLVELRCSHTPKVIFVASKKAGSEKAVCVCECVMYTLTGCCFWEEEVGSVKRNLNKTAKCSNYSRQRTGRS